MSEERTRASRWREIVAAVGRWLSAAAELAAATAELFEAFRGKEGE